MVSFDSLTESLRSGRPVSDHRFDKLYPPEVRVHSKVHFTPVKVALRVRDWIGLDPGLRVLDVGSGCGKFCLVMAASGGGRVTGIEQRPFLHEAAVGAAEKLGVTVRFLCGRMEELDWREFNVFYFFNPFYERIAYRRGIDDRTPPHAGIFFDHLRVVKDKLDGVKSGARVFTYHGMGGRLRSDWNLIRSEPIGTDELQMWVKA